MKISAPVPNHTRQAPRTGFSWWDPPPDSTARQGQRALHLNQDIPSQPTDLIPAYFISSSYPCSPETVREKVECISHMQFHPLVWNCGDPQFHHNVMIRHVKNKDTFCKTDNLTHEAKRFATVPIIKSVNYDSKQSLNKHSELCAFVELYMNVCFWYSLKLASIVMCKWHLRFLLIFCFCFSFKLPHCAFLWLLLLYHSQQQFIVLPFNFNPFGLTWAYLTF